MKSFFLRFVQLILATAILFVPGLAHAFDPPPLNGHHVVDMTGRLTANDIQYLDHRLEDENKQTTNEIAVLVIPRLNGEDIKDVGYKTAKTWQLGKAGLDNGVLFLIVAPSKADKANGERAKARIETGKGVGGALTDSDCNDIIRNKINPQFKVKNLRQAIDDGTTAAANLLRVDQGLVAKTETDPRIARAETLAGQASAPVTEADAVPTRVSAPVLAAQDESWGGTALLAALVALGSIGFMVWLFNRRNDENYDTVLTPARPEYSSPIYVPIPAPVSMPSYSDERTTVPLPTPVPLPSPSYSSSYSSPSRSSYVAPSGQDDDDDDDDDDDTVGDVVSAIGAVASIASVISNEDDDNDTFSGGGGDFGGGGSDDDLDDDN